MNIKDEFVFQRSISINSDENVLIRKLDLSTVTDSDEKISDTLNTLIPFLVQSGFDEQDLLGSIDDMLEKAKDHPDNDDFSFEGKVEEALNNTDMVDSFLSDIVSQDDPKKIRELYRRWLIVDYMEKERALEKGGD